MFTSTLKNVVRHVPHARRKIGKSYKLIAELQDDSVYGSPIPYLDEVREKADQIFDCSLRDLGGIDLRPQAQLDQLEKIAEFYAEMPFSDHPNESQRYYFDNGWYQYGDGILLYGMMRHLKPKRIVEIGSGFSSFAMLDTNQAFLDGSLQFTFIDPNCKRLRSRLTERDLKSTTIYDKPIQDVPVSIVDELQDGDILFVDSSHTAKIGSDVTHILFELFPRLASGVHVHVHDIYYPFEYPKHNVLRGSFANEAYLLRAFLQHNSEFEISIWNDFLARFHRDRVQELTPLALRHPGAAIWLRRK